MATANYNAVKRKDRKKQSINAPFKMQIPSSLRDPIDTDFSTTELSTLTNENTAREFALKYIHDPDKFTGLWRSTTLHPNTRRIMRKVVQIQTINAIYNGFYRLPDGTKINLDKRRMATAARNTRQYVNDYDYNTAVQEPVYDQPSKIIVIAGDCIDAYLYIKDKYPQSNPVVLNMASAKSPGGGWRMGSGAQEENLHRRTNMFQCLEDPYHELDGQRDWDYHMPEFGGIYSSNVTAIRGSESKGYPYFLDGPKYISFIACAAYSHPPTETNRNGELVLSGKNIIENTKKKMETIFNIARDNKHDIVILSAFGCGAYRNPPKHIAQLFREVIMKNYRYLFKCIVFAIIDDHNANKAHNPHGNIQPFADVFKVDIVRLDETDVINITDEIDENDPSTTE